MKIALVDDEMLFLDKMVSLCKAYSKSRDLQIELSSFSGGEEFLAAVKGRPPQMFSIVFLDIYMDGIDGIATATALREADPECLIIFITSSRDFMPEAFGCHAFDYISKPIDSERLDKVLDDALRLLPFTHKYIELVSDRKTYQVFLKDIVYAVTDGQYHPCRRFDNASAHDRRRVLSPHRQGRPVFPCKSRNNPERGAYCLVCGWLLYHEKRNFPANACKGRASGGAGGNEPQL